MKVPSHLPRVDISAVVLGAAFDAVCACPTNFYGALKLLKAKYDDLGLMVAREYVDFAWDVLIVKHAEALAFDALRTERARLIAENSKLLREANVALRATIARRGVRVA